MVITSEGEASARLCFALLVFSVFDCFCRCCCPLPFTLIAGSYFCLEAVDDKERVASRPAKEKLKKKKKKKDRQTVRRKEREKERKKQKNTTTKNTQFSRRCFDTFEMKVSRKFLAQRSSSLCSSQRSNKLVRPNSVVLCK